MRTKASLEAELRDLHTKYCSLSHELDRCHAIIEANRVRVTHYPRSGIEEEAIRLQREASDLRVIVFKQETELRLARHAIAQLQARLTVISMVKDVLRENVP